MATQGRTMTAENEIRVLESRRKIELEGEPSNGGNEMKCDCVVNLEGFVSVCVCVHHHKHTNAE